MFNLFEQYQIAISLLRHFHGHVVQEQQNDTLNVSSLGRISTQKQLSNF